MLCRFTKSIDFTVYRLLCVNVYYASPLSVLLGLTTIPEVSFHHEVCVLL